MKLRTILVVLALAGMFRARPARGLTREWNVGSGLWNQSANWNPAVVPGSSDYALVDYPHGWARITTTVPPVGSAAVVNNGSISITNQGSLSVTNDFVVAQSSGTATLNVPTTNPTAPFPGGLSVGGNLLIGGIGGDGTVNQNDGTIVVTNGVSVGYATGSTSFGLGTYSLGGAGAVRASSLAVGSLDSLGTFTISGSATADVTVFSIGEGTVVQSGGRVTVSNVMLIEGGIYLNSIKPAQYTLNGGTFTAHNISLGTSGAPGVFNYNGGAASLGAIELGRSARLLLSAAGTKSFAGTSSIPPANPAA